MVLLLFIISFFFIISPHGILSAMPHSVRVDKSLYGFFGSPHTNMLSACHRIYRLTSANESHTPIDHDTIPADSRTCEPSNSRTAYRMTSEMNPMTALRFRVR